MTKGCGENPVKEVDSERKERLAVAAKASVTAGGIEGAASTDVRKALEEKIDQELRTSQTANDLAFMKWSVCRECLTMYNLDVESCNARATKILDIYKELALEKKN
jgi:hypothetical protein